MNTTRYNYDPFFIGFESVFDRLNRAEQATTKYPPYNLIKTGEDTYTIELAVAGFGDNDINIQLHEGVLTVSANVGEYDDETEYLHKGIATRSFVRKFTLADTVQVDEAIMKQGILTIQLRNVVPEEKRPRQIEIKVS